MATQYTAGLTTGQVLTAATMNSIGAVWEDWTPTVTPGAGTITTANLVQARYAQVNKIILFRFIYFITNRGTAIGNLAFTLPVTGKALGAGGDSGIGTVVSTKLLVYNFCVDKPVPLAVSLLNTMAERFWLITTEFQ